MKKLIIIYVALVIALFTACAQPKSETVPQAIDETIEKAVDDKDDENLTENETEKNNDVVTKNNDAATDDKDVVTENKDVTGETKIDSGRFNGLADANFFEVKISGVPDSVQPKVFMLTDDVREKFQNLNLQQDDEIKLYYYETTDGQLAVTDIEKISQ